MNTPTLETLRSLRQTRQYSGDPVDQADVDQVLEVARWTGSAKNVQPWKFVVVNDSDLIAKLAGLASGWLATAPVAIIPALSEPNETWERYDEGRLSERIMLAAHATGLATGTTFFTSDTNVAQAKNLLGIPEEYRVSHAVALGHAAGRTAGGPAGGRKPLEEIVGYNGFE